MTIVLVAFRDNPGRAVLYKKFSGAFDCVEKATAHYRKLLEMAQLESGEKKPRVISTRIIVDE